MKKPAIESVLIRGVSGGLIEVTADGLTQGKQQSVLRWNKIAVERLNLYASKGQPTDQP